MNPLPASGLGGARPGAGHGLDRAPDRGAARPPDHAARPSRRPRATGSAASSAAAGPAASGAGPKATPRAAISARIRAEIEGRILSGAWPPGHRLPFEHDLAAQYGCARMTVNKALSALADAGLIHRRRRAGTFVAPPRGEQAVLEIGDFAEEAARRGLPYRHELLRRDLLPDGAGSLPGPVLCLLLLHRIGGVAVAEERRDIALGAAPGALEADFAAVPPGTWLRRRVPWTVAEHALHAEDAAPALARRLEIDPGAACLVLERRTWHAEAPVTAVRLTHAGTRHRFVGRFARGAEAGAAPAPGGGPNHDDPDHAHPDPPPG